MIIIYCKKEKSVQNYQNYQKVSKKIIFKSYSSNFEWFDVILKWFLNDLQKCMLDKILIILISVWKNPEKCTSIDWWYFYCIFTTDMTSICEKESSAEVRLIQAEQMSLHNFIILWKKNIHSWRLNNSRKAFLNQWESMVFCKLIWQS